MLKSIVGWVSNMIQVIRYFKCIFLITTTLLEVFNVENVLLVWKLFNNLLFVWPSQYLVQYSCILFINNKNGLRCPLFAIIYIFIKHYESLQIYLCIEVLLYNCIIESISKREKWFIISTLLTIKSRIKDKNGKIQT